MQFKLAILSVLASRPEGRATLDELRAEVEALTVNANQPDGLDSTLEDVDLFQSGLVIPEHDGLQITDLGRSALKALKSPTAVALDLPRTSTVSPSLRLIDDLIGTDERLKIFDLELRNEEIESDLKASQAEDPAPAPGPPDAPDDEAPDAAGEYALLLCPGEADDSFLDHTEAASSTPAIARTAVPVAKIPNAPAFLAREHSRPGVAAPKGARPPRASWFRLISARLAQAGAIWRRHLEQDGLKLQAAKPIANLGGSAVALLTLLVLVICAGALFALTQIRSLKSEVAALQRELLPLRDRATKADLLEKAKQSADQQKELLNQSAAEKFNTAAAVRAEPVAFTLTAEEIRLIREYIKPAPSAGTPVAAINVGDTVSVATIPLPSPLMEKIPKLLGARFTTRNGAIVILRRESRKADVVLPPN